MADRGSDRRRSTPWHHVGPGRGVVVGGAMIAIYLTRHLVRRLHSEERGVVTVISALLMTALLGMLALAVDIGFAFGQRRMAQNVADSGAMAAAQVVSQNMLQPGSFSDRKSVV